ncbi:MAG: hypothetical protein PUD59_00040 [bacterium]|nr:hypothetical protein [bacterium]
MVENNILIEQLKEEIKKLKFEILKKEEKIDELLKIINKDENFIEEE